MENNKKMFSGKLQISDPLYLKFERSDLGTLSQLAPVPIETEFEVASESDGSFRLTHASGLSFIANLKNGTGKKKGKVRVVGNVEAASKGRSSFFDKVNIQGETSSGERLRPAQIGAVFSLLSHWSLTNEVATVVLPTGTGKTETMLATTLAGRARRTLIIVPTVDLKDQIAEKFATWGILRRLGIIPTETRNPTVLVLQKTVSLQQDIQTIERSDVVVTTPGLLARSNTNVRSMLEDLFSHVYFDEAHHVIAKEWSFLKQLFRSSRIVQFTATPYRNDRKPIEGKITYNYPMSQALADNCFSKISLVAVNERHPKKKDKAIADAAMDRLLEDRERGWNRHRMMVRAENQAEAERIFNLYCGWFPSERIVLVHSKTKGRKSVVADIKQGKYDIIVCVDMLKEGFDYPDLKVAAVHGVHKSLAVLLQFIGRFTRFETDLGDASFVVNYSEERISLELENLFQEGCGWEEVISEIADAKKAQAESLLSFLQGCKPLSSFDDPDVNLNPKLVYPALSCVCFHSEHANWNKFKNAFNLKKYALSHPFLNIDENVFYFSTQKREKVKWARTEKLRDQTWDLIVMHHDPTSKILYIGSSDKRLDVNHLVETITGEMPRPIDGDSVFRSFDSIKRLSIVHAGIFKPANHLHRYSRLSGADVTNELTKWQNGQRCKKSDFVGVGFREGFPVGVGASVKGKIWSPARSGDLQTWKAWCLEVGKMITDGSIDANQLLEDSAKKVELDSYPEDLIVLATDWSESLYERIHKLTIERPGKESFLLAEAALTFVSSQGNRGNFLLKLFDENIKFSIDLGGEQGHNIIGLDGSDAKIDGLKSTPISLKQLFEEYPPTLFLLNGCTIAGCIHTDYGEEFERQIPDDRITVLDWQDVGFTVESQFKSGKKRANSIQEYVMRHLVDRGAKLVFNDDNAGESADVVGIFFYDDRVRFELVHCKYSKAQAGLRLSDLYEVCGQAIVSLRYKWRPADLLKHMERRNGSGALQGKRIYHGQETHIDEIRQALRYSDVEFEFAIAQPGVNTKNLTINMKNFLGSVYSTVVEMTETKLRCYFSD